MSDKSATALDSLGEILPSDPGRDAIHLATFAVTSDEKLFPGQHIGIIEGNKVGAAVDNKIGIVDPFLPAAVFPGQMFWLVLYPRTITSLRHVWTHPAFGAEANVPTPKSNQSQDVEAARARLKKHLNPYDYDDDECDFERNIQRAAENYDVEHFTVYGYDAAGVIPDSFWDDVELVTGKKVKVRAQYFACSC